MVHLSVNVNKLATLRNSRGKNLPDVAAFARKILAYGAHGITVHPRPDGRHIRAHDVREIAEVVKQFNSALPSGRRPVEFNIEGFPSDDFIDLIREIQPDQATLVPDPPEALTSNAGWDLAGREDFLRKVLSDLRSTGAVKISLFVDPEGFADAQKDALARLKPDRIELYTEAYHDHFGTPEQETVTARYQQIAITARGLGVGVNAGHDLNQKNLGHLCAKIPWLNEVSIGHALVCEALEDGFEKTIKNYLAIVGG